MSRRIASSQLLPLGILGGLHYSSNIAMYYLSNHPILEFLLKVILEGIIVSIIGGLILIGWDTYKDRRETNRRDTAILEAIENERRANIAIFNRNLEVIHSEHISMLSSQRKRIFKPSIP
jgi:hypothetical protein